MKKDYYFSELIYFKKSPTHGYGVFAKEFIKENIELERPRYAVIPSQFKENLIYNEDEKIFLKKTSTIDISNYIGVFYPIIENSQYIINAILLGNMSFANWATNEKDANIKILYDIKTEFLIIKTIKNIEKDQELFIKKYPIPTTNLN